MTPDQLRVARALLNKDRPKLRKLLRDAVSLRTIEHFEAGTVVPRQKTIEIIDAALAAQGITFDADGINARLDPKRVVKAKRK